jgi:hypothetical protein
MYFKASEWNSLAPSSFYIQLKSTHFSSSKIKFQGEIKLQPKYTSEYTLHLSRRPPWHTLSLTITSKPIHAVVVAYSAILGVFDPKSPYNEK